MSRSKEIETAAFDYVKSDAVPAENMHLSFGDFINGAKWADEHPNLYNDEKYHTVKVSCLDELNRKAELYDILLNKACGWLKKQVYQEYAGGPFERLISDTMIEDFSKAMGNNYETLDC